MHLLAAILLVLLMVGCTDPPTPSGSSPPPRGDKQNPLGEINLPGSGIDFRKIKAGTYALRRVKTQTRMYSNQVLVLNEILEHKMAVPGTLMAIDQLSYENLEKSKFWTDQRKKVYVAFLPVYLEATGSDVTALRALIRYHRNERKIWVTFAPFRELDIRDYFVPVEKATGNPNKHGYYQYMTDVPFFDTSGALSRVLTFGKMSVLVSAQSFEKGVRIFSMIRFLQGKIVTSDTIYEFEYIKLKGTLF